MGSTLSPDPTRPSTNFQSFGQYSEFLRSAVADEESLQMGDELQALAVQVGDLVLTVVDSRPAHEPGAVFRMTSSEACRNTYDGNAPRVSFAVSCVTDSVPVGFFHDVDQDWAVP